jgi:two-component system response regulator RegA
MRILIVDDDEPFRLALRNAFLRRGYEVSLAGNAEEASAGLREAVPHYAVVDLRMPGRSGLDVVRELRALPRPPQVVVLTGYGSIGTAVEAVRLGALNPRSIGRSGST